MMIGTCGNAMVYYRGVKRVWGPRRCSHPSGCVPWRTVTLQTTFLAGKIYNWTFSTRCYILLLKKTSLPISKAIIMPGHVNTSIFTNHQTFSILITEVGYENNTHGWELLEVSVQVSVTTLFNNASKKTNY